MRMGGRGCMLYLRWTAIGGGEGCQVSTHHSWYSQAFLSHAFLVVDVDAVPVIAIDAAKTKTLCGSTLFIVYD